MHVRPVVLDSEINIKDTTSFRNDRKERLHKIVMTNAHNLLPYVQILRHAEQIYAKADWNQLDDAITRTNCQDILPKKSKTKK